MTTRGEGEQEKQTLAQKTHAAYYDIEKSNYKMDHGVNFYSQHS